MHKSQHWEFQYLLPPQFYTDVKTYFTPNSSLKIIKLHYISALKIGSISENRHKCSIEKTSCQRIINNGMNLNLELIFLTFGQLISYSWTIECKSYLKILTTGWCFDGSLAYSLSVLFHLFFVIFSVFKKYVLMFSGFLLFGGWEPIFNLLPCRRCFPDCISGCSAT